MPPQPLQPLQPFKSTLRASSSEFEFSMVCPHHPAEAAAASRHQLTAGTEGGGGGGADERRRRKSYIDHSEELGDGVTRASLEELPGPEMEESNNLHLACEMLELQVRRVFFHFLFSPPLIDRVCTERSGWVIRVLTRRTLLPLLRRAGRV